MRKIKCHAIQSVDSTAPAPFAEWAEANLQVFQRKGDEWTCLCSSPDHNDTRPSMHFNVREGIFLCFSCGHKGRVNLGKVREIPEFDFDLEMGAVKASLSALSDNSPIEPSFEPMEESALRRFDLSHKHWDVDRKFTPETQQLFQLGYDHFKNGVTVPLRNAHGDLLGVMHRLLDVTKENRYRYPLGFQKAQQLFGSWLVAADPDIKSVALVEGPLDAIPCWQAGRPALSLYGAMPSPEQVRLLEELGVEEVVMFFDNDREGANAARRCLGWWWDSRTQRYEYRRETDIAQFALVRKVDYKIKVKDPGEMSMPAIRRHIDRAVTIL